MDATRLRADALTLGYGQADAVVRDLSLEVPDGGITSIIGPNGCGKSTLLRGMARLLAPRQGAVLLDGEVIQRRPTKEVAKHLGLLPQQPSAPAALTVEDLVRRGRFPHQSFFQPLSEGDRAAVEHALQVAGVVELRDRAVDELSGGQRQRAWIAMALAQETPILLLDEPTTYLDVAHQREVLELLLSLKRSHGTTIVTVLHDMNSAAEVSDLVVAMRGGSIVARGTPQEVLAPGRLREVFGVECDLVPHPAAGRAVCLARSAADLTLGPRTPDGHGALRAHDLAAGYGARAVVKGVTVEAPPGQVTAIVGPNGCGKSTLLRALAKLIPSTQGAVFYNERPVAAGGRRQLARRLAMLSQGAAAPAGVTVEELVAIGRHPYRRWYRQWSEEDQVAIDEALAVTRLSQLRWRAVESLSGGQAQRVWLALALAQRTEVLLLDEPTTFLDISHQVDVLDLVWRRNRAEGTTVVVVLHDLCHACRYADQVIAMKDGAVVAAGATRDVITSETVRAVFGVPSCIVADPQSGKPLALT